MAEETNKPDQEFWDMADSFINMANELSKKGGSDKVSVAMLYAASRYNVFNVARVFNEQEAFEADQENATKYFADQYVKMFSDNYRDYISNFSHFRKGQEKQS